MQKRRSRNRLIVTAQLCAALVTVSGCGRTVLISDDAPIRIGPDAIGHIYIRIDGQWVLSKGKVKLPEGWYVVPPRFVHPDEFVKDSQ